MREIKVILNSNSEVQNEIINTFPELLAGMLDCLWYS